MLNIVTENSEDSVIVRCRGRLVAGADVCSLYDTFVVGKKTRGVVLDLTEVTRVDARGLGILVALSLRVSGAGIRLELIPSKHVQELLDLTSLHSLFEIRSSETLCPADFLNGSQDDSASSAFCTGSATARKRQGGVRRECSSIPHVNRTPSRSENLIPVIRCGKRCFTTTSASSCSR